MIGELKSLSNDSEEALKHYQYAYEFDASASILLLKQAEELVNLGRIHSARDLMEKLQSREENNPEFHVLRSRVASQEMNLEESLAGLSRAIELYRVDKNDQKVRELTLTKVAHLSDYRKYDEAIKTLEKYVSEQPDDEVAHYFLGKVHAIFENRDEAKRAYERALNLRPNFPAAVKALGLQYELEGNLKEAALTYHQGWKQNNNDEDLLQKLINLSLVQEDYSSALSYLSEFLKMKPRDSQNLLRIGLVHFRLGDYVSARDAFVRLKKNRGEVPEDKVDFYLGVILEELREFPEAVSHLERVLGSSEYYVEARIRAAQVLNTHLKKPKLALKLLAEAEELRADSIELPLVRAMTLDNAGRLVEGVAILRAANDRIPKNERILFLLGSFLERAGAKEEAVATMRSVIELNPNHAHALNHVGYYLVINKKDLAEAEKLLIRAVQNAPDNGFILDSLGWLYFQREKYQKARDTLERAAKLAPHEPVILEHLAQAYERLGDRPRAHAIYQQILAVQQKQSKETIDPREKEVLERARHRVAVFDSESQN